MAGPEFFQTRMGQVFYEHTMPNIAKAIEHLATVIEKEDEASLYSADGKKIQKLGELTKETILKYTSEDELFAVFHTFEEYWNQIMLKDDRTLDEFRPTDAQIGEVIKHLKQKYK
jgi:hypothetical protein